MTSSVQSEAGYHRAAAETKRNRLFTVHPFARDLSPSLERARGVYSVTHAFWGCAVAAYLIADIDITNAAVFEEYSEKSCYQAWPIFGAFRVTQVL
jgi:hypothetical protein